MKCQALLLITGIIMSVQAEEKTKKDPCANYEQRKKCLGDDLLIAAERNDMKRVKELMEEHERNYILTYTGYNTDERAGYTALMYACERNSTNMVEYLLQEGSRVDHLSDLNRSPLFLTAINGNAATTKMLLDRGADPNTMTKSGQTPLFMAAWNGYPAVVKMLLEKDAEPNIHAPNTNFTPLYFAAKGGFVDMVESLVKSNATINVETSWGVTPLQASVIWKHLPVVKALLAAKANPNIADKDGLITIHKASHYGYKDILQELLKGGAMKDRQDKLGRTALHHAVLTEKVVSVNILLAACCNTTLKTKQGETALRIAEKKRNRAIINALKNHQACT